MYCLVSPFSMSFDNIWLLYLVPDFLIWELKEWQIVEVPVKNNIELAVVFNVIKNEADFKNIDNHDSIDISKIKPIISIFNNNIFLQSYQVELIKWISKYYFTYIHNSLNLFFPKNVKDKIWKGKLELENQITSPQPSPAGEGVTAVTLSELQSLKFDEIKNSENNKILLYWITWSWKTEIYIKLIEENLKQWRQSLLLIPEIILTNQISTKIEKAFPEQVVVINSSITEATKTKHWKSIYSWKTKVIVWTRSALFYPFYNLWIIIIDEEHDNSYTSDKSPRYDTREVAEKLSDLLNIKLLLASGTPSVKSMYKWVKWEYKIVNLLEKYK